MNNTFSMLVITGVILCIVVLLLKKPVLYLFGASDTTYPYADSYLSVYMLGSVFMMVSLGMNGFINAQGFANRGMLTVVIGAVVNIVLDPLFILCSTWVCRARRLQRCFRSSFPPCGWCASCSVSVRCFV